jgi:hypothetical protein
MARRRVAPLTQFAPHFVHPVAFAVHGQCASAMMAALVILDHPDAPPT